ncbi:MAG: butyrate kinase [Alistipes sp.]|nr:butyrate kinase [Alistipes senegalensis]MCM1250020.1 butyrate kinase [Alistipes sp.]
MAFKILAINPGSTSTKVALYEDERPLLETTLRHSTEEVSRFANVIDQLDWRRGLILQTLRDNGFDLKELSAVIGRGGLIRPVVAGVYEVNSRMRYDLRNAQMKHACNLGGLLAAQIAHMAKVKAYIADPPVVDEMDDVARITGMPMCPRKPIFHALNQKAIARLHCEKTGLTYEKSNLIVAHMGGGISVAAHRQGRIADVNNALDGDGPFAPDRAGNIPSAELIKTCFSGKYTKEELLKFVSSKGGLVALLGTNSVIQVMERIDAGDERAAKVLEAMCYNIAKQIGAMAAALSGRVDGILLTGGIANNEPIVQSIRERCAFIAPITVYPGENELEALAINALVVLRGVIQPKEYK